MAGDFITVTCPDCENEQTVFGKASTTVKCAVCGTTLATPSGGEAELAGEVVEVAESR